MDAMTVNQHAIAETYERIKTYVRRTPVIEIDAAELGLAAGALTLKLELLQHSGSFKARGAFANLTGQAVPAAGVAAASGGNHGAAVAFAAQKLGHPAHIFVPTISSPAKIERIRSYGADLVIEGSRYAEALQRCQAFIKESGALSVHAYDAPLTLLGQGTVGLELETQAPKLDTLLVAVGGGGLIGGIAAWYQGRVKVIGVEPETAPTLHAALAAGSPVDVPVSGLAADSLGASRIGGIPFGVAREHVAHSVLVPDDAIRKSQLILWDRLKIAAEPGGAAVLAALLTGAYTPARDEGVGVLICGGNTTAVDFSR
ncbi:MAG: threonine/serine dehydratase [Hyphomicrobiaceae bacterium]